jgi:hypothetical protein
MSQIVGESSEESALVLHCYKDLLEGDRTFLVPILGSLGEMPLPESLKGEVYKLAEDALPLIDESDLPVLMKTILSTMTKGSCLQDTGMVLTFQKIQGES